MEHEPKWHPQELPADVRFNNSFTHAHSHMAAGTHTRSSRTPEFRLVAQIVPNMAILQLAVRLKCFEFKRTPRVLRTQNKGWT